MPGALKAAAAVAAGGGALLLWRRRGGELARLREELGKSEERTAELRRCERQLRQQLRQESRRLAGATAAVANEKAEALLREDAALLCESSYAGAAGTIARSTAVITDAHRQGEQLRAMIEQAAVQRREAVSELQRHLGAACAAECHSGGRRRADLVGSNGSCLSLLCEGLGGTCPSVRVFLDGQEKGAVGRVSYDSQTGELRCKSAAITLQPDTAAATIPQVAALLAAARCKHDLPANLTQAG
eukprot:TRINITY_DN50813_c0_g1_i1.p1 TRINITY_DN50813_c0_g1~~TRINITY_DN50813_c0_g1_i1.p1  ORF type:complete len:268 (+),score=88.06 TRINITY_DN50813_c0_g1_i1:74-805(+)